MYQQKHQHHSHQQCYDDEHLSTSADNIQSNRQQEHTLKANSNALSSHRHHHHHHHQQQRQHEAQQEQEQQQQNQHQQHHYPHQHQQRRSSQSPHHSRHTSPHSRHSHSLHSSPHESYQVVNHNSHGGIEASNSTPSRTTHSSHRASIQSSSSHSHHHPYHHHHHHRRRSRHRQHSSHHTNGSGGGGSGNSSIHGAHGHSHHSQDHSASLKSHVLNCSRRHRSTTDISSASLNMGHDAAACADREVQEIFVQKSCCSSSRTELAQFFAEDLYGTSRRPSSCCTSSDYCYQTDSTSLYGSRSSLSRNNSVKSASVVMRKKRAVHQRQPSYTSISLHGLSASRSNDRPSQIGSLSTVFDCNRTKLINVAPNESFGSSKYIVSPSKATLERQTSKDASQDLPEYACSPSPIRWSFLADEKSQSEIDLWRKSDEFHQLHGQRQHQTQPQNQQKKHKQKSCRQPKHYRSEHATINKITPTPTMQDVFNQSRTSITSLKKPPKSPFQCDFEESSTTVLFHQEGEAYDNCCNSYIQCNTYLDQDLQITSEDIHQYLSKGSQNGGDILNNSKSYPFQPSNALEFQYKNNFANNSTEEGSNAGIKIGTGISMLQETATTNISAASASASASACAVADSSEAESVHDAIGYDYRKIDENTSSRCLRQNSTKDKNSNNNWSSEISATRTALQSRSPTPISSTNIKLSTSCNNVNITSNAPGSRTICSERNSNEVKFINTMCRNVTLSTDAQNASYLPVPHNEFDESTSATYDYTNSAFKKHFSIDDDEQHMDFDINACKFRENNNQNNKQITESSSSSDGQHSSPLPSPVQKGVSFESFDASSDHNLISQRGSCQFSSPTPRSPLSPGSPDCSSSLSASVNPSATTYLYEELHHKTPNCQNFNNQQHYSHHHHHHHRYNHRSPISRMHHSHCNHGYDCYHQQQNVSESFKLSNAFKKVRKRARKYTEFLRKK